MRHGPDSCPTRRFKEDLLLFAAWSSSPGSSGHAALLVRRTRRRSVIVHWDDDQGSRVCSSARGFSDWRAVAAELAAVDYLGLCPSIVVGEPVIEGARGIEAELLLLAWGGETQKRVAQALLTCSDDQLAVLRRSIRGPFAAGEFAQRMKTILEELEELDHAPAELGQLVSILERKPSLPAIRREVRSRAAVEAEREAYLRGVRRKALDPFAADIAALMVAYKDTQRPIASGIEAIGRGMRMGAVHRYIERYVLRMGCLPSGKHVVAWPTDRGHRTLSAIPVDFDDLREP